MVPPVGVEPTLPCGNQILSLARLPIPPQGQHGPHLAITPQPGQGPDDSERRGTQILRPPAESAMLKAWHSPFPMRPEPA